MASSELRRILALEPYYGGSHQAFLDGWSAGSRHSWTVLSLPAFKWKWRMRHAAITLADRVAGLVEQGQSWDLLFCSDMLNLAEFLALAPDAVQGLPAVAYFHENQLTYPVRAESERDWHFAFTNITTALAATGVWFNSAFHRDSFLEAADEFLRRMPDHQPVGVVERIGDKSSVHPPGVEEFGPRGPREPGPLRILWAARWEHDKNPEAFFEALKMLEERGVDFRVSVIGQRFRETPPAFDRAREHFAERIGRWGYLERRADYRAALTEADVIVSTADHEFFGISIAEAVAAGAYPLVPDRLSYPEILDADDPANRTRFFYDGRTEQLAEMIAVLADRTAGGDLWQGDPRRGVRTVARYTWKSLVEALDRSLEEFLRA